MMSYVKATSVPTKRRHSDTLSASSLYKTYYTSEDIYFDFLNV